MTNTKNSISYMEWSYAKDNNLKMAQLDSGSGPVELTGEAVGKAVDEADIKGSGNDLALGLKYTDNAEGPTRHCWSPTRSSAARALPLRRPRSSRIF